MPDAAAPAAVAGELIDRFQNPPSSANLGAYWYWLGGNVTAAGITADLESMKEAGITQPMLFSIGKGDAKSPIKPSADALTDYWWSLVEHAVRESERLGLTLALNACDGWATASGPWITPDLSMQHVVWSEVTVKGGRRYYDKLPVPAHLRDYYRDIAILALPFPESWDRTSAAAKITSNLPLKVADPQVITDPANTAEVVDTKDGGWIVYAFDAPFTLRSITVHTPSPEGFSPGLYRAANSLEVQASDDGETFRTIGHLEYPKHGWQTDLTTLTHAIPQTTARYFRLVHHRLPDDMPYEEEYDFGQDPRLRFYSIVLSSEPRIHHHKAKNGDQWAISRAMTAADLPDAACVKRSAIRNLTGKLAADGTLSWQVPPGRWRILRIGYSTTGFQNSAAGGAQGLECDRFNVDAVKLQFDNWYGMALAKIGPRYAGKVLHVIHVDSWEAGAQNWSPGFDKEFRRLRGYDLLDWLPVMAGIPVDSAETSERILFDLRRTVSDLTSEKFYKTVADLAHANGCVFSAEPPNPTYFHDGLEYANYADLPMGEFWLTTPRNDKPNDVKDAVSGARVYGKPVAATESFTEGLMNWRETPYSMKAVGDHNYCEGINRFMLHVYAQQPWVDREPGMTLNGIGSFVSRTQTWWKPARAWFQYLRRCQALLQAGRAVSDFCAFTGESIPARAILPRNLSQQAPTGYSYDSINRDALLRLTKVENGEIVLESGMRYKLLLLPDERTMTPEIAAKLRELVSAGACIIGPRPERSPSFQAAGKADQSLHAIATEVWGDLDGKTRTERRFGQGRVVWGKSLATVLGDLSVGPDVELKALSGETVAAVEWTHRQNADWDVYFISNQSGAAMTVEASFRVENRIPEIWYPDTGRREDCADFVPQRGRTKLPLRLDPSGSLFVVFAKPAGAFDPIVAVDQGNAAALTLRQGRGVEVTVREPGQWRLRRASGRSLVISEKDPLNAVAIEGPWQLRFARDLAAPRAVMLPKLKSWTRLGDPSLKYYSGTAVYRTAFELARGPYRYLLDLGEVRELAEIKLNGRALGVLWKPPFVLDVTEALAPRRNVLEIHVTNTWNNRMIGDTGKSEKDRITTVVPLLRKGEPWLPSGDANLAPSGLLGPVLLRPIAVHRV